MRIPPRVCTTTATLLFSTLLAAQTGTFTSYGSGCSGSVGSGCVSANFGNLSASNFQGNTGASANFAIASNSGSILRVVCALEFYCKLRSGSPKSMSVYLYADDGQGNPGKQLATASVTVSTTLQVYRATFAKPVIIASKTPFYVAFDNRVGLNLPIMTSGTDEVHYFNGPPTWRGPYSSKLKWNYNVVCCGAGQAPVLSSTSVPTINKSFSMDLSKAKASTTAILVLGLQKTSIDLSSAGAPGCSLLTNPLVLAYMTTNTGGTASVGGTIPNDRMLIGAQFFAQYAVFDSANALGVVFSNGGDGKIGA